MSLGAKARACAAAVAVAFGAYACGGSGPSPTPTAGALATAATPSPTPVNPEALLRESGRAMEGLSSFHFRLDHERGGTALLPTLVVDEAEGDVVKPDKISAQFVGGFAGFGYKSSLVTIGDDSYMTNPLTGKWESVPKEVSPLGFFDPGKGVVTMMSQIAAPILLEAGEGVYRIAGTLPAEALAPLVGTTVEGVTVGVEVTIGADDLYLQRARFDGKLKETEDPDTVRVITLSRFNEPVAIEPPQLP